MHSPARLTVALAAAAVVTRSENAGRRLIGDVAIHGRAHRRRPERARLRNADVLDLRINTLDPDAEILLERELHGVINRYGLDHRVIALRGGLCGVENRRARQPELSGLRDYGHREEFERAGKGQDAENTLAHC